MVIGKERTNWYKDHPSACTCTNCEERRKSQLRFDDSAKGKKIGRNEKCPCGSGRKYKKCHAD